jgi:hypothetical protein
MPDDAPVGQKTNIFCYCAVSALQICYGAQSLAMNGCPPNVTGTAVAIVTEKTDFFYQISL